MYSYAELIDNLHKQGALRHPRVLAAFKATPRVRFLSEEMKHQAGEDVALPIGYEQTNSQPYTVAFMLELLEVDPKMRVLDVGCGSGWTSALLGYLVEEEGSVIGTEIVPELAHMADANTKRFSNIHIEHTEDILGYPSQAPYDRILVSAGAEELPQVLLEQLKIGGIMVIPIGNSIYKITKYSDEDIEQEEHPGFMFVPLIT